jgi:CBS domain-containing protein
MNEAPVTIDTGADYKEAFEIMKSRNLHHLPVLDESKKVVGILALRDLKLAAQLFHEAPVEVADVMHTPVTTIAADANLIDAVNRLTDQGIGCLPVFKDGSELVGIITETDMLRALRDLLGKNA